MRIRLSLFLLTFLLFATFEANAQMDVHKKDSIPSGRNSSATAAMQGALLAMGGTDKVGNLGACVATGTVTNYFPDTNTGTFRWVNSGDNYRYETTIGTDSKVEVSNGGAPASSINGAVTYWPSIFASFFADAPYMVAARLLRHYNDTTVSASMASDHKALMLGAPKNTFVVRTGYPGVTDPVQQLIERDWEINSSNGMPAVLHISAPGYPVASVKRVIDYVYSSYSSVNGVMIPLVIEMREFGVKRRVYSITSVRCRVTVDASQFAVAGGAQ
jgi:hypothetical protein